MALNPRKPLGGKAYGSIPHLPSSRLGPGDWSCPEGQQRICWERARDGQDRIIVTEKLDGSCCAVANIAGAIVPLVRAGYPARTSPHLQHHLFADWVAERAIRIAMVLEPGQRIVGEWLAQAHGTRYLVRCPFVAFDLFQGRERAPHDAFLDAAGGCGFVTAAVLHDGGPIHLDAILPMLASSRHHALDPVEGAVWRVERRGRFDFIAKWVRPDKQDGYLLPEMSGQAPVWNWWPAHVTGATADWLARGLHSYQDLVSDLARELGCEPDNETILAAVAALKNPNLPPEA